MAKAAKAPAKKTSPLVWVGLAATVVVVYMTLGGGGDAPTTTTRAKKKTTSSKDMGVITQADLDAQKHPFAPVAYAAVDAFNPLIKKLAKTASPIKPPNQAPGMIEPSYAGGEANWYYTGCPELNGQKQALLENTGTGDTVYVRTGDEFKSSRVASIDVETVVLVGKDGKSTNVHIQDYGEVPGGKTSIAANAPLVLPSVALSGPIGIQPATGPQTITLSNGQTLQLPATDASAANNTNQGRRGRRRNRNQNPGDPNDGN